MIRNSLNFILLFIILVNSEELPGYIKKCKRSDPNFNECVVKNANEAIPILAKGDSKYKLINMSPIVVPVVELGTGPNLQMKLSDVTTDNLKEVKILKANFDINANKLFLEGRLDRLQVLSTYFIKGQIMVLPINGEGHSNITLDGLNLSYEATLGSKVLDGAKYITIEKAVLKCDPKRVYFHFDNLFGGDPRLSKQMNEFLDTNWKDFYTELQPALEKTVSAVTTNALNAYFSKVPFEQLFD